MSDMNLENIGVMIADAGGQIRSELKKILHFQGYRNLFDSEDMDFVRETIAAGDIDLLITDFHLPSGDACDLIQDIRHQKLGNNPFIVAIIMVQEPEQNEIMKIIDSGSDDLILKPITTGLLTKRVDNLMTARKRFVVTSDYIGPTRRKEHRAGTEKIPEFNVPNPLEAKARGGAALNDLEMKINKLTSVMNEKKLQRNAVQISFLANRLSAQYKDGETSVDVSVPLKRLLQTSEDIGRRLKGTKYDHVGDLCESLLTVATGLSAKWQKPDPKDLQLLPELAGAISAAFGNEADTAKIARSISESVQKRT